jgi:hypothetical protein
MRARRVTSDPDVADLGRLLNDALDRISDLEQADQASERSIDSGSLDIYDDDDNLRARIGKQPDGSYSAKAYGKKPQTPTEPDVIPVPGGCIVEWDGTFEEAQEDDVQRVAIHVGLSENFAVVTGDEEDEEDDQTEKAAILSPRGGSAFLALDPGEEKYWVRLTAIAEGQVESDPTDSVEVIVAAPEGAFYQDEFTLAAAGAGQSLNLTFTPLDHSDHLYWNGLYQREDVAWTRIGKAVTLTGTPYPAKVGDRVVVEYAYNPGEEPKPVPLDGMAYRIAEGSEGYVLSSLPWEKGAPFTVASLIRLRSLPPTDRIIFATSSSPSWKDHWRLWVTPTGQLKLWIQHAASIQFWENGSVEGSGGSLADLVGHHVAFTYEHPTGRVFVDGTEVLAVTVPGANVMHSYHPVDLNLSNLYISSLSPALDFDEYAVWTRRLPESEIDDMVRAWSFGELPSTIVDSAPSRYTRLDTQPNGSSVAATVGADLSWYAPGGTPYAALIPAIQRGE